MKREVIIACDFSTVEETLNFLELFTEEKPFVKIGMELYYSKGPEIVRAIKERGHKIFLDLKLHDIPTTVYKAMKNLVDLDVDMVNVHAAGSIEMMAAAKQALVEKHANTILIAVTQLTSTSEEVMQKELLINESMAQTVKTYALNTKKAGLDGVVCSPHEAHIVSEACGESFMTVTPGIRFESDDNGDQKRVATPAKARELGCTYIVVGRSITTSKDPVAAYKKAMKEFLGE